MDRNPWKVDSIWAFTYLHCPECEFNTRESNNFQDHAVENHPLSSVLFKKQFEEKVTNKEYFDEKKVANNEYFDEKKVTNNEYYDESYENFDEEGEFEEEGNEFSEIQDEEMIPGETEHESQK